MGSGGGSWGGRRGSQCNWEAAAWFIKMGIVCQGCLHRLEYRAISQNSSLKMYVSIIAMSWPCWMLACRGAFVCACVNMAVAGIVVCVFGKLRMWVCQIHSAQSVLCVRDVKHS